MSKYQNIIVTKENFTGTIKINRPKVFGALNRDTKLELIRAIRSFSNDNEIGCIVLTGEGKAFCSGQDLNDTGAKENEIIDLGEVLETEWNPLVLAIRESKKIVIGAINGICAGAGVSLALACDLVIANSEAKFISGFTKIGLCPDAGITNIITSAIGSKRALEFFVLNTPLSSKEMQDSGLINLSCENFLEKAKEWATKINLLAPLSVEQTKSNVVQESYNLYKKSIERETTAQRLLGNTQDHQEGLSAFFEKRSPKFRGS